MTFQQTIMEHEMWARREGEKKGEAQGILQMVLKMFRHDMSVEDIAKISELSVSEVNSMIKNASAVH